MFYDEVFGELEFDSMWKKKEEFMLYGKEFEIILFIQGEEKEGPSKLQGEAYQEFNSCKNVLVGEIEDKIYEYYQSVCDEYRGMYEEDADKYAPIVNAPEELKGFVKPQSIMIPRLKDEKVVNILFKTKWDLEMGIGIQIVNGKIEVVGVQSEIM